MRAISLMSVLMVMGLALGAATSAAEPSTFSKRVPANPTGRVRVSNVAGSVTVKAWDRPEVDIQAQLGAGVERVDVTHDDDRTVIVIEVVRPRGWHFGGEAVLEIRVPVASRLEISTVSAPITVEGVRGGLYLNSVSGGVRTDVSGADMEVKTVSGSVDLRGNGQPSEMRVSTVSGNLLLAQGAGALEANTTSGNLDINLEAARTVRVHTISGALKFSGRLQRNARLEADTISGYLSVQATAEAGYQYEVSTFSGAINNCFGEAAVRTSQYAPGRQLSGKRGAGEGNIRLKTLSGGVTLCDRSAT